MLAQAIYREGVKTVAAGANPMAIKRGIEGPSLYFAVSSSKKTGKHVKGELKKISKPVTAK